MLQYVYVRFSVFIRSEEGRSDPKTTLSPFDRILDDHFSVADIFDKHEQPTIPMDNTHETCAVEVAFDYSDNAAFWQMHAGRSLTWITAEAGFNNRYRFPTIGLSLWVCLTIVGRP